MKNRILIVEDDIAIAESVAMNLNYSGYDYIIIDNGLAVVSHLEKDHSFDLVLLDIMLPGLDGFELMEYIEKYNIPVLYLTAKTDIPSRIKGLRGGAEDYIIKPFDMLELLVRMEKILERTGKLNKVLRYQDITIDLEKRTLTKAGDPISMQPLEFDLFVMLVKYINCTLSREYLLTEVWGMDYLGGTRTVDMHIAQIRKKLNLGKAIATVSKIGYRLES